MTEQQPVHRFKCLACEALARLIYWNAAQSPHIIDVELFRLALHRDPDDLRARLQARIDQVSQEDYDAILMAYGLCGKSTAGLTARTIPLVIPRAHDCITLFLGDRQRYADQSSQYPGTYWYALDYIQRAKGSGTALSLGTEMALELDIQYAEFVAKYGKDNADYLIEVMGAWQDHYNRAVYVDMGVGEGAQIEDYARQQAEQRNWQFSNVSGDLVLIRRLLFADWQDDFLVVQPGSSIGMTFNQDILCCIEEK